MIQYNYRLDTSNLGELLDEYEVRQKEIKANWRSITSYFLEKGTKVCFKYWAEDITSENFGHSAYGINELIHLDDKHVKTIATDGLNLLTVHLTNDVKEAVLNSIKDNVHIVSFFHFDILNEHGEPLYTSQDFGGNLLFFLTNLELAELTNINKELLISLPEEINTI